MTRIKNYIAVSPTRRRQHHYLAVNRYINHGRQNRAIICLLRAIIIHGTVLKMNDEISKTKWRHRRPTTCSNLRVKDFHDFTILWKRETQTPKGDHKIINRDNPSRYSDWCIRIGEKFNFMLSRPMKNGVHIWMIWIFQTVLRLISPSFKHGLRRRQNHVTVWEEPSTPMKIVC
jgi:hypothetical protein